MEYTKEELLKMTAGELVNLGICPTCFNKENNGALYGDDSNLLVFSDDDIECLFVSNPRASGHMCIVSKTHYHDLSEAPDELNEKIIRYSKKLMNILKQVYGCERVYLCSMCDGPNNHYHVQLIPRYKDEKIGSTNFVKPRTDYVFDKEKFNLVKKLINQ